MYIYIEPIDASLKRFLSIHSAQKAYMICTCNLSQALPWRRNCGRLQMSVWSCQLTILFEKPWRSTRHDLKSCWRSPLTVQKLVACDDSHLYSLGTQIALYIYRLQRMCATSKVEIGEGPGHMWGHPKRVERWGHRYIMHIKMKHSDNPPTCMCPQCTVYIYLPNPLGDRWTPVA